MAKLILSNSNPLLILATALWALSAVPVAYADKICRTDSNGKQVCKTRIPKPVVIAIVATILGLIVMGLILFFVIRHIRNKRASNAAVEIYAPDAVQISSHAGPISYGTTYGPPQPNTFAGPSGTPHIYPGSADPNGSFNRTAGLSGSRQAYNPSPKYPAHTYPFNGFGVQPQSAVAGGYPGPSHGLPNNHGKDGSAV